MKLFKYIIVLSMIIYIGCNNPSDPNGTMIEQSALYSIETYCYDVDLNDNVVILAASDGGYYKYTYELNSNGFPVLTLITHEDNHNTEYANDSIDRVILSSGDEGVIYKLDRYTGGSSGLWFDNAEGMPIDPELVNDYCYQGKYLDMTLDESEPDNNFGFETQVVYSLMKHTDLNENNDGDEFLSYSTSIVRRPINVIPDNPVEGEITLSVDNCYYEHNLNYDSNEIHFGDNRLAVANESSGIVVFKRNNETLVEGLHLDSLFSFNLSGGQAQTVFSLENAIIGGFSNDKGCYMALLASDVDEITNYISFADGYSIKGIDYNNQNGLIALATGSDGVHLYLWNGGNSVSPYGSIDTGYAYDLKIENDLVFVATQEGLEIYKIGI